MRGRCQPFPRGSEPVIAHTVTIVIVSYKTRDLLGRCLRSVMQTTDECAIEIVVVDNASADGSVEMVRREFPDITLIESDQNLGYAAACNLGAATGTGDHILLLNPDTEMRAGCLPALLDLLARRPDSGTVGGRAFFEDGRVNPQSCYGLPTLWSALCFGVGLSTLLAGRRLFNPEAIPGWDRGDEREVGVVTGALLLCTRALWERVGGLSPAYFVYGEDVELAIRVRELGYRPRITPLATLVHVGGAASASSAAKWQMMLRGKVTVMRRCWSPRRARIGIALLLAGTWLRATGTRAGLPVRGPWQANWRDRRQWVGGWEAAMPQPATRVHDPET